MISRSKVDYSLYLITDSSLCQGRNIIDVIQAAIAGGVSVVQLREKNLSTREFVELARAVKRVTAPLGVPLIINDRVDIMAAAQADGVHVGQTDIHPLDIRAMLGHECIVGLSVDRPSQIEEACKYDLDYIGLSSMFGSTTGADTGRIIEILGLVRARFLYSRALVALGGINETNAESVYSSGADGIAVVSAICSAPDPMQAAARLRSKKIQKSEHDSLELAEMKRNLDGTEIFDNDHSKKSLNLKNLIPTDNKFYQ